MNCLKEGYVIFTGNIVGFYWESIAINNGMLPQRDNYIIKVGV